MRSLIRHLVAAIDTAAAGMAMRESKTDQQIELIGSCSKTASPGPDSSDYS